MHSKTVQDAYRKLASTPETETVQRKLAALEFARAYSAEHNFTDSEVHENLHDAVADFVNASSVLAQKGMKLARILEVHMDSESHAGLLTGVMN